MQGFKGNISEMKIRKKLIKKLLPPPVKGRHREYSMLFSADDDISRPSEHLIKIAFQAIQNAQNVSFDEICIRMKSPPFYPDIWPGEHYKLLAGLVITIQPKLLIEVGTGNGLSALAIKKYLPQNSKIITFDIIEWENNPDIVFETSDFSDGTLIQYIDDLSNISTMNKYREILERANIIFVDAAKDGVTEQKFIDNLKTLKFESPPLLIFDDIRLWNMLRIWREIPFPKLDLTSFGHWTGTGLVDWNK